MSVDLEEERESELSIKDRLSCVTIRRLICHPHGSLPLPFSPSSSLPLHTLLPPSCAVRPSFPRSSIYEFFSLPFFPWIVWQDPLSGEMNERRFLCPFFNEGNDATRELKR